MLFEYSGVNKTMKLLLSAYRKQFSVMSDKDITDETKQKELMNLIPKQLLLMGKLIIGILLFVAPFLSLFFLKSISADLNPDILITWWGIVIPIITVVIYIYLKRIYGNVQQNR